MPYLAQLREESVTIPRRIMINPSLDGQRCVDVRLPSFGAADILYCEPLIVRGLKLQFIRRRAFEPRPKLSQHKHHVLCRGAPSKPVVFRPRSSRR